MSYRQGREGGTRFTFIRKWGEWEGVKIANFDTVSVWTLLKLILPTTHSRAKVQGVSFGYDLK